MFERGVNIRRRGMNRRLSASACELNSTPDPLTNPTGPIVLGVHADFGSIDTFPTLQPKSILKRKQQETGESQTVPISLKRLRFEMEQDFHKSVPSVSSLKPTQAVLSRVNSEGSLQGGGAIGRSRLAELFRKKLGKKGQSISQVDLNPAQFLRPVTGEVRGQAGPSAASSALPNTRIR
jgi:hypothetical protein